MAEFDPVDWASVRALDLISIALSNPYNVSLRLIACHLREIEGEGALRGAQEMSDTVHAALDRWSVGAPINPPRSDTVTEQ
jgi:hypothetical protein